MRKLVKGSGFKMLSPFKLDNQTQTSEDFDKDYSGVAPVDLGTIKASDFTRAKTELEKGYVDAGKQDEFMNEHGGEHNDFYYDPARNKIRSGVIEYPEEMEGIPEHYKGKNWVKNTQSDK